jgi:patatin-like phospholipase/acyl hydrolase
VLACVLVLGLVSCATPPPVRQIPPERIQYAQQREKIASVAREALIFQSNLVLYNFEKGDLAVFNAIYKDLNYKLKSDNIRKSLGESLANEIITETDALRQALKGNNVVEVNTIADQLRKHVAAIRDADILILNTNKFLNIRSIYLPQSLKHQIEVADKSLKSALQGDSWEEIDVNYNLLNESKNKMIVLLGFDRAVSNYYNLESENKIGPELKYQADEKFQAFRLSVYRDSWDEILANWTQLREIADSLEAAVTAYKVREQKRQRFGSADNPELLLEYEALDEALHDDNWNDVLYSAKKAESVTKSGVNLLCVRILSIDGGGMRGIIPAMILEEIERRSKKPIYELFDVIVGTSTGGIIALGLTLPDPQNPDKPRYRAKDLVAFYEKEGEKIFPEVPFKAARALLGPQYSPDGIEEVLKSYFGKAYLFDALTNVIIPAYEIEDRMHVFFSTYDKNFFPYYMWEVARAASAAPTYFPPFRVPRATELDGSKRKKNYFALIDGGVFANDPSIHAIISAKRLEYDYFQKPDDPVHSFLLLSIGTGRVPSTISFEEAWNWGLINWAKPLVDIMFSDPGRTDDARSLATPISVFYRLQPDTLVASTAGLDNWSQTNLQQLKKIAINYINRNNYILDNIVRDLLTERMVECRSVVDPWQQKPFKIVE